MQRFMLLIVIFTELPIQSLCQNLPRVRYRYYSEGGQRRLELRVSDGSNYVVVGAFAGRGACAFPFVGNTGNKYGRVINLSSKEELVICGVVQDPNNANIYSIRVFTQQYNSLLMGSDAVSTVVFNFKDNPGDTQFRVSSNLITVNGDPTNIITPEVIGGEAVRLAIIDANGNEIAGRSVSLSDSIRARVVLQISNPVSGAVGVRGYNLMGRPAFGSSQGVLLVGAQGCGVGGGGFIPASEGFVGLQAAGNEFWSTSPPFQVFYFINTGQPTLVLEAELEYCVSSNSSTCVGNQCQQAGRRRRQAEEGNKLIARKLIVIDLEPKAHSLLADDCSTSLVFLSTVGTLLAVLVISLTCTCCFVRKIITSQRSSQPSIVCKVDESALNYHSATNKSCNVASFSNDFYKEQEKSEYPTDLYSLNKNDFAPQSTDPYYPDNVQKYE